MMAVSDLSLHRRFLEAVQKPARLRDVAEHVNGNRPGWDTISDHDVRLMLGDLESRGYVQQTRGGWWLRTERGILG